MNMRRLFMLMPVGLMSGIVPCCSCPALAANIVVNSGFEASPALPNAGDNPAGVDDSWGIFDAITGWSTVNGIEVWSGNWGDAGQYLPYEGNQLAELDPSSNAEIYQLLPTIPGQAYSVSFAFRKRHDDPAGLTAMRFYWDGGLVDTLLTDDTNWSTAGYLLQAADATTEIRFAAAGTSDSYGDHLDAVSVSAIPEPSSLLLALGGIIIFTLRARRA